jgi:hypothetical protein
MGKSKETSDLLSASDLEKLRSRYTRLAQSLAQLPWVCQGSVMPRPPCAYRWTRKVNQKTITVALSQEQAALIDTAIKHHRMLEEVLKEMRDLSERALLGSAPGVRKRTPAKTPQNPAN